MRNTNSRINILTLACALIAATPCISHAVITSSTTDEIVVKCNVDTDSKKNWHKYAPKPNTQYTLATLGVKIPEEKDLITVWGTRPDNVQVFAKCIPSSHGKPWVHMFPSLFSPEPLPVIKCDIGEGIIVGVVTPTSSDPDYLQYHGLLTITEYDDDGAPSQVDGIPPLTQAMQIPNPTEQLMGRINPPPVMVGGSGNGGSPTK